MPAATGTATDHGLLGRDRELGELCTLLDRALLVTVTGPAGVGKSRLAGALAASDRWVAWTAADLAEAGNSAMAHEIISRAAARLPEVPGARLLLLDNCDLVLGEVASSVTRLAAGEQELRIVVTSRECLGLSEETVYRAGPLTSPDAGVFFATRAGAQHGGVVPEISSQIQEICVRLDGLPLALELAAAQTKVLTQTQILARLDDPMRLLISGPRSGAARHRSLRAALDWGAATLVPRERVLLHRLSVFAGAFTLDDAERICAGAGLDEHEVLEALAGLVAKSLVDCDPNGTQASYRLMRTVRQYALPALTASGEADLVQRNRVAYATERPDAVSAADLAEALRWCGEAGAIGEGLRLAAASAPCWLLSGRIKEGSSLLARTLAQADGQRHDCTRTLLAQGMLSCALGQADEAARVAEQAAARFKDDGDDTGMLWAQVLAGAATLGTDPRSGAHRIALAAAELPPDSPWTPVAIALGALAAAEAGQLGQALEAAEESLAAARAGQLAPAVIVALLAVARVARDQGRLAAAEAALGEAETLAAQSRATGALAVILTESCRLALDRGSDDDERNAPRFDQAVALAAATESPLLLAEALDVAGRSSLRCEDGPAARSAFARVTALSKETGAAQAAVGILGLGQVALAAGSASAAWILIEEANAIARAGSAPVLQARTLQTVGDCARSLGDASRAWSAYHRALGLRIDAGLCVAAVESLESLAELALEQGRFEYGVRLLGAATGLRDGQGSARPGQVRHGTSGPAGNGAGNGAEARPETRPEAKAEAAMASLGRERFAELHAEGMRLSLPEAAAYACRQRGPRQRGVGWVSLTPAERQVADLAATGLTNKEIGQRLFSSPRTIQAHLSHIFAKLGISSRRMLAAEVEARNKQLPLDAAGMRVSRAG